MRFADLSAADRRAIRAGAASAARAPGHPSVGRRAPAPRAAGRWTCIRCGRDFRAYQTAEIHADREHAPAARIEMVLR